MRLIDADTVKQDIYKYIKEEGRLINPYRMLDYIDSVKTSKKAIHIEWITRYIDSTLDEGNSQMLGFKANIIKEMIEEWEKENAVKISEGNYDSDEEYEEQMRCLDEN